MYPVHKFTDSYPRPLHLGNHSPYSHHYYPSWEVTPPPQMNVDPAKSSTAFEPWSYNHGFGYPDPTGCHGCCNNCYPSGYYSFRPPHFQHPSPPLSFHGPYSYFTDSYPAYFVPPHYPSDQARYEYDKNMSRHHCCGCMTHSCNCKGDSNVKIEEEKTMHEQKDNDPTGLVKLQNHPYPLAWIPPNYVKDKETSKPSELESKAWNGWVPFELNSIRSLKQGGEDKRNQNQQEEREQNPHIEDNKTQLPYPIIWIPGFYKPEEAEKEDLKEVNSSPKVSEELPSELKVIPVRLPENEKCGGKETTGNGVPSAKETRPKSIPVKQLKENEEIREKKSSDISNVKKPSSSPVKASKLPPVCLRVDPLPKRTRNSNSRSPSPPGAKERGQLDSKAPESIEDKTKEGKPKKKDTKVIEVKEKMMTQPEKALEGQSKDRPVNVLDRDDESKQDQAQIQIELPLVSTEDTSKEKVANEAETNERKDGTEEHKEVAMEAVESKGGKEHKLKRKELSNTDAAILIQSAYRGFEVRRWEPLKKLKQIARVSEQVNDVKEKIHGLETSSRLLQDEKERIVISETIMGLLLQLDTIQGLHPSVREIRKSVARELVCLQEKLDSLTVQAADGDEPALAEMVPERKTSEGHEGLLPESISQQEKSVEPKSERVVVSDLKLEGVFEPPLVDKEQHIEVKKEETSELPLVESKKRESNPEELVEELANMLPMKDKISYSEVAVPIEGQSAGSESHSRIHESVELPSADERACSTVDGPTESLAELGVDELVEAPQAAKVGEPTNLESVELPSAAGESEFGIIADSMEVGAEPPSVQDVEAESKLKEEELPQVSAPIALAILDEEECPKAVVEARSGVAEQSVGSLNDPLSVQDEEAYSKLEEISMQPYDEEVFSEGSPIDSTGVADNLCSEAVQESDVRKLEDDSSTKMVQENCNHECQLSDTELSNENKEASPGSEDASEVGVMPTEYKVGSETEEKQAVIEIKLPLGMRDSVSDFELGRKEESLVEQNMNMKEMLEKVIEAGKHQLAVISDLNGRVRDLERKLSRKKKLRMRRQNTVGSFCSKPANNPPKERTVASVV
ncbi:BCL-2-associated athanogene 6 [Tasmannia lanceolata]|uniref:BCL-2-associated athanogene 6 n=1 Tax=Tasmannia lanceolata TaxID=3420 RepID=UPI0040628436